MQVDDWQVRGCGGLYYHGDHYAVAITYINLPYAHPKEQLIPSAIKQVHNLLLHRFAEPMGSIVNDETLYRVALRDTIGQRCCWNYFTAFSISVLHDHCDDRGYAATAARQLAKFV